MKKIEEAINKGNYESANVQKNVLKKKITYFKLVPSDESEMEDENTLMLQTKSIHFSSVQEILQMQEPRQISEMITAIIKLSDKIMGNRLMDFNWYET